jgi:hypothetical protein
LAGSPLGITQDAGGLLYVSHGTSTIADGMKIVATIDPSDGSQSTFDLNGSGPIPSAQTGVTFDGDGNFYLASNTSQAIFKYGPDGSYLGNSGHLESPIGIAYDPLTNKIFWTDSAEHRVYSVLPDFSGLDVVASGGFLSVPRGLVIDNGTIFVADAGATKRLLGIDKTTGNQWVVSSGGLINNPVGLALLTAAPVVPLPAAAWMALPLLGGLGVVWMKRRKAALSRDGRVGNVGPTVRRTVFRNCRRALWVVVAAVLTSATASPSPAASFTGLTPQRPAPTRRPTPARRIPISMLSRRAPAVTWPG